MGATRLRVFSLNCWTVPFTSTDTSVRVGAIGRFLAESDFDIVFLQEIWSRTWYDCIKRECEDRFKDSRCYFSGRIGTSGLCIFSRFPIVDTFFHPFLLNGYWHQIHHGDNHVSKGIAFARVLVGSITVNCFFTHLIAEYDRKSDIYYAHRLCQAYELLKLTDLVSPGFQENGGRSFTIVAGDLNLEPQDLGVSLLRTGGFIDSWPVVHGKELGATCDLPDNCYTPSSSAPLWPQGRRIDYVLHRPDGLKCDVVACSVLFAKVPGKSIPLSDHEGVTVSFDISVDGQNKKLKPCASRLFGLDENVAAENDVLAVTHGIVKQSASSCDKSAQLWLSGCIAVFFLGIFCVFFTPGLVNCVTSSAFTLLMVFLATHYHFVKKQESIHLLEISQQLEDDLNTRSWKTSTC